MNQVIQNSGCLQSDNAKIRGHAATILGDIGDMRAKPAVQNQAENDSDVSAKAKAAAREIDVESELGQYTEFTVRLPCARRATAPAGGA